MPDWGEIFAAPEMQDLQPNPELAALLPEFRQAGLRLVLDAGRVGLGLSINVINHGDAAVFRDFCRELDRVLAPGGGLFIYVSPREFGEHVKLPQTRELEPGTLGDIATPDGTLLHHVPI